MLSRCDALTLEIERITFLNLLKMLFVFWDCRDKVLNGAPMHYALPFTLGALLSVLVFYILINVAIDQYYFGAFDPHGDLVVFGIQLLSVFCVSFLASRWTSLSFATAFVCAFALGPIVAVAAYALAEGSHPGLGWVDIEAAARWVIPALAGYLLSRVP